MNRFGFGLAVLTLMLVPFGAAAEGDAKKGEKVYRKCKACHVVDAEKNRVGPHLVGIMDRPAASVEKFKYSKAMKKSGLVWDAETLDKYLENPRKFLKGGRMAFVGLKKQADRDDVIAYLKEAAKLPDDKK